jgi:two-component system response regulator PilR (NtrC family)
MKIQDPKVCMQEPLIIGKSAVITNLLSFIKKAAKSEANIFILGEIGVGKELAAKFIQLAGDRKRAPFLVNCFS